MCDGHLPPFTMRFGDFKSKLLLEQNDVSLISKQGKIFPGKI